jgi:hypothetical protein
MLPAHREDHFFLALKLRGMIRPHDDERAESVLDRLAEDIAGVTTPRVLVSQEALAPTTPAEAAPLLELLAGFEVHLVVTARDLARQLPSAWQQRVQARHTYTFDEFLRAVVAREELADDLWINQDLGQVLDHWSTHIPPERIHVVTAPQVGSEGSLLDRYCSVIGVDPAGLQTGAGKGNRSLGYPQAELLRRVNVALGDRFPSSREGYGRLGKVYLAGRVLQRQRAESLRLPTEYAEWCGTVAEGWIQRIRESGFDLVGQESDLRPSPDSFAPAPHLDEGILLDVATAALADVLEVRHEELEERAALRARNREQAARIAELERELGAPTAGRRARGARRALRRGRPTTGDPG